MRFNKFIIDTKALKLNALKLKKIVGENVKLCGVVKANAYNHGIKLVANNLKDICDFFAVANFDEAMDIRSCNIDNNILVLGIVPTNNILDCIINNISLNLSSIYQLHSIIKELNKLDNNVGKLKVHISVNTGMNRLGFSNLSEFKNALKIINEDKRILIEGIFTHFATKESDKEFILSQYKNFEKFCKYVDNDCIIIHNCSTYATLNNLNLHNSMVRCGFALYGYQKGFKPVLNIKSEIVQLNKVKNGTVGYDRTFKALNRLIGVVPIGYADGFDRRLSNNFKVLVNGEFVPVVGYVCMDMFMIDLTNVKDVKVGSEVVLLGSQGDNCISIYDYAKALDISPYEVFLKFQCKRMDIIEK